jgi:D-alanyl-D-alanine endopeptidase (penicillin-binding protein 7)
MKKKFLILGLMLLTTGAFAAEDESQPQAEQPAVQAPVEAQAELPPLDVGQDAARSEDASQPAAEALPVWPAPDPAKLRGMRSAAALVVEQDQEQPLYAKNTDVPMPIASITKLMTAMLVLDAQLPFDEPITISKEDVDTLRGTRSKLQVGLTLTRQELLQLALMASENRAAAALARTYPGGVPAFVAAMNRKAKALGMMDTQFVDATGLNSANVSTAQDLVKMVKASYGYELIREYTTAPSYAVTLRKSRYLPFHNSNRLVKSKSWDIGLSKTGYIRDSGRCLVMQVRIAEQKLIIVLLDSWGKYTRIADANRIKRWIETGLTRKPRAS